MGGSTYPRNSAKFRSHGLYLKWQRRFFIEFSRALPKKSLGGHLGVNIFAAAFGRHHAGACKRRALSLLKPKPLSLFGPVDGQMGRQSHQLLRRELRRVFAVDDGCDDIGRHRRQPQKA